MGWQAAGGNAPWGRIVWFPRCTLELPKSAPWIGKSNFFVARGDRRSAISDDVLHIKSDLIANFLNPDGMTDRKLGVHFAIRAAIARVNDSIPGRTQGQYAVTSTPDAASCHDRDGATQFHSLSYVVVKRIAIGNIC